MAGPVMRVWITRTRPAAERTAERVAALGHVPVVEPVLETHLLRPELSLERVGALAFTSGNAVDAFVELSQGRDLPAFAVGDATAAALRAAGFRSVLSAGGDVGALARLIAGARPNGVVLHLAGSPLAGDLAGALTAAGVGAKTVTLYKTRPAAFHIPDAEAALIHSPQAARVLAEVVPSPRRPALAFAISPAAAEPLVSVGFPEIRVATRPDEAALLDLLPPAGPLGARRGCG